MGEISDALRRAREREEGGAGDPASPAPRPASPSPRDAAPGSDAARDSAAQVEIPAGRSGAWRSRAVLVRSSGAAAERFRQAALRLRRELGERGVRSLALTSALRGEGKTTSACNLALALADLSSDKRFVLVDLDLRRPAVAAGLSIEAEVGVERVLSGFAEPEAALLRTQVPNLDVLPALHGSPYAHQSLASPELPRLLEWLEARYDTIVLDTSPVLLAPDTTLTLARVDAWLLISAVGVTRQRALRELFAAIPRDRLLGALVNRTSTPRHVSQYGYYHPPPGAGRP